MNNEYTKSAYVGMDLEERDEWKRMNEEIDKDKRRDVGEYKDAVRWGASELWKIKFFHFVRLNYGE